MSFDALVVVAFGGPEAPAEVMPFLEHVTRGRGVPHERLLEVAGHYRHFGGKSPINEQCRSLCSLVEDELRAHGNAPRVYWGNRHSSPWLADTVRRMADAGVERALAFVPSAYGSYSSCRVYLEAIEAARAEVGARAPLIEKLRLFFDHPLFVEAQANSVTAALARLPEARRAAAAVVGTAHSIPLTMAHGSGYAAQLAETLRLVRARSGCTARWDLAWQSRSGPPSVPWLEPSIEDRLAALAGEGVRDVVLLPIGFVLENLEVTYDLDVQATAAARTLGVETVRAATVGTTPELVRMARLLVEERSSATPGVLAAGCAPECCKVQNG